MGYELISQNDSRIRVGIQFPKADPGRGRRLAPVCDHPVHRVADYKQCPEAWSRDPHAYFMGVDQEHELWFDFRMLNGLPQHVAVVISIQRLNAVTGKEVSGHQLEQYKNSCPIHNTPFSHERLCTVCGYKWPGQNYVTNAAGMRSESQFWLDGWRTHTGEIAQFVFSNAGEGLGVAEQILGSERSMAIGVAIYVAKEPKPAAVRPIRRGQPYGVQRGFSDAVLSTDEHFIGATRGLESYGSREESTRGLESFVGKQPRVMDVSAGRSVDQMVFDDPMPLSRWKEEPEVVFTLIPAEHAWVEEVVRNGPNTSSARGPLTGLRTRGG